jgi:hypothetical protein
MYISILGLSKAWLSLFYDGPIKDADHRKKQIELWGSPQLINESQFIPIIVTKISLVHEYILNCLLCHPRLNVMEWSHPYPLCWVQCQGCLNGLTWHLTQHNGLELDHSIVHNGIGTTSQGAVPLSTEAVHNFQSSETSANEAQQHVTKQQGAPCKLQCLSQMKKV